MEPKINKLNPTKTALLVIDMQNDFCHPEGKLQKHLGRPDFSSYCTEAIKNLCQFSRELRTKSTEAFPIIWIQADYSSDKTTKSFKEIYKRKDPENLGVCVDEWGKEIVEELKPKALDSPQGAWGEISIEKNSFDAFHQTALKSVLDKRGIEHLVVVGVATSICVESTVRSGFSEGYNILLVEDGVGGYPHEEHLDSVKRMGYHFGTVVRSDEVIKLLN